MKDQEFVDSDGHEFEKFEYVMTFDIRNNKQVLTTLHSRGCNKV